MPQTRNLDYPMLARNGFLFGVAMLVIGVAGQALGPALVGQLPGWEATLFLDLEILGILTGLFAPLTFGIVLPLTE